MKDWDYWDDFDAKKKDGYRRQGLRVASPGNQLLGCDKVDVRQSKDRVNKLEESLFAVSSVEEPGRVEEERERRLALGVVLQEVLGEDLLDGVGVLGVEATVRHGAGSAPVQNRLLVVYSLSDHQKTQMDIPTKNKPERMSQMLKTMQLENVCSLCVAFSGSYLYWSGGHTPDCLKRF